MLVAVEGLDGSGKTTTVEALGRWLERRGRRVHDGRRDASYLEIDIERGRLAVWRRSLATGRPTLLYEGARATPR